jgi:ribosomal protein S18 acetylase RimI-like enzyme
MDLTEVLDVDKLGFEPFWQLDSAGIDEAILATPRARYRVAVDTRATEQEPSVVGYAIMGHGAGAGFLQRLAVHPDARGHGIGSLLVADGFKWLTRWGCRSVSVNTQETNERALRLYEHLGFLRQQRGIVLYESPPLR